MSKYSVGGVEIISDSGTIAWSKVTNKPLASLITSITTSVTNCAFGGNVVASFTGTSGTRSLNLTFGGGGPSGGGACACACG